MNYDLMDFTRGWCGNEEKERCLLMNLPTLASRHLEDGLYDYEKHEDPQACYYQLDAYPPNPSKAHIFYKPWLR